MRLRSAILLLLFLSTALFTFRSDEPAEASLNLTPKSETKVHVKPALIKDTALIPSNNFTVELRISNVTDLYGFDIVLRWNASLLNYTSHSLKIPVEDYPGGVLYKPIFLVGNQVNITAGSYWVAASSLSPAASFNGSGVVFEITFTIIEYGEGTLDIWKSAISNSNGESIEHSVENGYFSNVFYDVAVVDVSPSPTSAFVGEQINITVAVLNNGTLTVQGFNVTINYDNITIDTQAVSDLPPAAEINLMFYWNTTGLAPRDYIIWANATILHNEDLTENNRFDDGVITLVIEPIYDVAITTLTPSKTMIFPGYCFSVNATVVNNGNLPANLNVTLYTNDNEINRTQIHLAKDQSVNLTFTWTATDATEYEEYVLNVTADWLNGENNTVDNSLSYSNMKVVHPGDFDSDMDVDIFDIVNIAIAYDSRQGEPRYDSNFDVNCDDQVNIFDIVAIAPFYGYERS
ncbi:MAG: hypothetical protein NWE78_00515 [Candidatus Bathyarchaeota archaeon]|nr:hypothetical protein [Candidatus Bathyarchaeota archaeon]